MEPSGAVYVRNRCCATWAQKMSISKKTYFGSSTVKPYSSIRRPDERVGRPSASGGPLSRRKLYTPSWLCVYSLISYSSRAISPSWFQRSAAASQSALKRLPLGSPPVP